MLPIHRSDQRGTTHLDWLKSCHTFSFGEYVNPKRMGCSDLCVINEDWIAPGQGFAEHPHRDMEIFTYVLSGQLQHRDSMGNGSIIQAGDVQIMSAGSGIRHSEFNPSEATTTHLLQIWIKPNIQSVTPRYHQITLSGDSMQGAFHQIVSHDRSYENNHNTLPIYQDAAVYVGRFDHCDATTMVVAQNRCGFVQVIEGNVDLNNIALNAGDSVQIPQDTALQFNHGNQAHVLFFDLQAQPY